MDGILKVAVFLSLPWKMALLWIFIVTGAGSQKAGDIPHVHTCQIHTGSYQNQRVELIGVEERMVMEILVTGLGVGPWILVMAPCQHPL